MTDAEGLPGRLVVAALIVFAAVTPLLPIYTWKSDATILSALLLVAAVYIHWRSGGGFGRSALDVPAGIFLVLAALATVFSVSPFLSFVPSNRTGEGLLVYLGYVVAVLAAVRLGKRERGTILAAVILAAALVSAIGMAQFFGVDVLHRLGFRALSQAEFYGLPGPRAAGPMAVTFGARSNSTMGNPIFLGGYAALVLPLTIALTVQTRGRSAWTYGVISTLIYGALVASQTRAAWIAASVGIVVLVVLLPGSRDMWRRVGALAVAFVILTVVMVVVRQQAMLAQRAVSIAFADGSLQQKLYVWKHTLPLIAQRPLLGWGFSTLLGRFPDIGSAEYLRVFGFTVIGIDTPHNDLLHIAYSMGILGLGAFLWMWVVFARSLRDSLRAVPHNPRLDGALLAALVAYFIWVQSAWTQVGPAHVFWVFGGMAVAMGREAIHSSG